MPYTQLQKLMCFLPVVQGMVYIRQLNIRSYGHKTCKTLLSYKHISTSSRVNRKRAQCLCHQTDTYQVISPDMRNRCCSHCQHNGLINKHKTGIENGNK